MTRKQLQALISAGVFSAALLSGAVYAEDAATPPITSAPPHTMPVKPKHKHKKMMEKGMAKHSCAGKNDCKGQGGCKTSDGGCSAKNSCKSKGGCATDGSMK